MTTQYPPNGWTFADHDGGPYYIRPLKGKAARRIVPDVVAKVTGVLATPEGQEILNQALDLFERFRARAPKEGAPAEEQAVEYFEIFRDMLPVLHRAMGPVKELQVYMEDEALAVLTDIPQEVIDNLELEEALGVIIETLMYQWKRFRGGSTTLAEVEGALKKSGSEALEPQHDSIRVLAEADSASSSLGADTAIQA